MATTALGGYSLLDGVVYGRVAGKTACRYIFGKDNKFQLCPEPKELKELIQRSLDEFGR